MGNWSIQNCLTENIKSLLIGLFLASCAKRDESVAVSYNDDSLYHGCVCVCMYVPTIKNDFKFLEISRNRISGIYALGMCVTVNKTPRHIFYPSSLNGRNMKVITSDMIDSTYIK